MSRARNLLESIELKANELLPLVRQLRQQGPHGKDQVRAISALEHEINALLGIQIGEAKVLFDMGPATIQNGQKKRKGKGRPPPEIPG